MMKKLPGILRQAEDQKSTQSWIGGAKRTAVLPVPVVIARQRIKTGFIPEVVVSQGLFDRQYKCQAHSSDTEIDVQFTVQNSGLINYKMQGKLSPHPSGSSLELQAKAGISFYIMVAVFLILPFFVKLSDLFALSILVIAALAYFIGLMWHRKVTADKVSELMQNLVSGHFVNNGNQPNSN
jgi:hypothetical protein